MAGWGIRIKNSIQFLLIGIASLICSQAFGEEPGAQNALSRFNSQDRFEFTSFDIRDGLLDNEVLSIAQDAIGFIWLGTRNGGLSRYDGHEFRNFEHDANDPTSISSNWIWSLYLDSFGILWVGTNGGGLNRYDPKTESFVRYAHSPHSADLLPDDNIKSFLVDDEGQLWVGSNAGLSLYDRENDTFISSRFDEADGLSIRAALQDRDGAIWLGTRRNGLIRDDPADRSIVNFRQDDDNLDSLSHNAVTTVFQDAADRIWVGTRQGLNRYNTEERSFESIPLIGDVQSASASKYVTRVYQDAKGRLWSGTRDGLYLFDPEASVFNLINPSVESSVGTPPGDVTEIFEDRAGNIWIGSRLHGVYFLDADPSPFLLTQTLKLPIMAAPNHNNISAIHVDQVGRLWSGGNGTPLNVFHADMLEDVVDANGETPPQRIQVIDSAMADTVWVGGRDGLWRHQGGDFSQFLHDVQDDQSISGDAVLDLSVDGQGGVWIAVDGEGVDFFNGQTFERFGYDSGDTMGFPTRYPKSVVADGNGGVWVGTNNEGLVHIDRATQSIQKFLLNPDGVEDEVSNYVRDIAKGSDGLLWLATNNGLYGFDTNSRKFIEHITADDGLLSNTIMAIIADDQGHLWLSSLSGVMRFDPTSGTIKAVGIAEELQGGQFLPRAVTSDAFGRLYWGTGRGILSFHPSETEIEPKSAEVILTGLEIDGKPAEIGSAGNVLTQSITVTKEIEIPAGFRQFSLVMSDLMFGAGALEEFFYKLEGFDTNWQSAGSEMRYATYRNVPPGNYHFVIANSAAENPENFRLQVAVLPLWWQTVWFRWGLIFLAAAAVGVVFAYQNRISREFKKLAMFADQSPHPVLRFDQSNRLTYANGSAGFVTDWFGLSLGDKAPESWTQYIEDVRQTGYPQDLEEHDKDAERHAIFTLSLLNDRESINVFGRDTTMRNELHRQLVQSQKMEAVGQLAGGIAHDFNNVLAIVQGNLELAALEDDPSPETKTKLDEAINAVTMGANLTRRLLAFSRKQKLHTTSADINHVLEGMHSLLSRVLDSRYEISLDMQDDLWPCLTDISQLENAVVNLAVNARDAMPKGGSLILKTSNAHSPKFPTLPQDEVLKGDFVLLQVTDTGRGIPAENLDRIFEPFFTTKDAGEGTGLGLSMAFGFAKQSSGHLSVKSQLGVGTTFELYLPRAIKGDADNSR